eukprot:TRINITY_DN655_c0_g1_i4.p1 TRINITY_DN655_c0_g1~~TRINITY_DN655_c0_g1_i4.p1  ORF type:complete len:487 (-),score=106.05 TRINITY_DN655_c0_g1_i4:137-1597(-)
MYCYQQAGDQHGDALTDLGFIYQNGIKIPLEEQERSVSEWYVFPDQQKAEAYYEKAKELENPRALNNLGLIIIEEQKNSNVSQGMLLKAIKYFEQAYYLGSAKAAFNLGMCYEKGWAVNQNFQKAKSYYREASDKGDIKGKLQLAHYLMKDANNDQEEDDYFQAYNILQEVIKQNANLAQAYYYLGFLYENGFGVTQDMKIARNYFVKATQCNPPSSAALTRLGDYYYQQQKSSIRDFKNQEIAVDYYQQAAKLGNKTAMNNLGVINQQGLLGGQNIEEAKKYYKQAGDKQGYLNLAILYSQIQMPQEKVKKNLFKASYLLEQTAIHILNQQFQNSLNEEKLIQEIALQNPEILDKQLLLSKQQSQINQKIPVVQSVYQSAQPKKQFKEQKQQNSLEQQLNNTCRKTFLQYCQNNQQCIHLSNLKHILISILNELGIQKVITDQTISKLHTMFNENNDMATYINFQELLLIVKTVVEDKENKLDSL